MNNMKNNFSYIYDESIAGKVDSIRGRRICLVNFSSDGFEEAQKRQNISAASLGEFTNISSWSMMMIKSTSFYMENKSILDEKRGSGYWLWKPYIIMEEMNRLSDGDFIVYYDAGRPERLIHRFISSIKPLIYWCEEVFPILFHPVLNSYVNHAWTKRDCFHLMNCDDPYYWNHPQIPATYIVLKVCQETRRFVESWLSYCCDRRILTDDPNTCALSNLDGFQENRHDQSVLTNLALKFGYRLFPSLSGDGEHIGERDINVLSREIAVYAMSPQRRGRVNLAKGRPCRQSSVSAYSRASDSAEDARGAVKGYRRYDYSFCTGDDEAPWWSVDLQAECMVDEIIVFNRPGASAHRAQHMIVECSTDGMTWQAVFTAGPESWNPEDPLYLQFSPISLRHLRIRLPERDYLHLDEVEIYGVPTIAMSHSASSQTPERE